MTLKKHTPDRAYLMYEEVDQDRERLRRFLPWVDHLTSVEDELWYINETISEWEEGNLFDYGMYTTEGEYIGNIGVHTIQWKWNCCELGYWIVHRAEGQGYISTAVQMLEEVLFETGFHRIEIRCDPNNAKSAAVPQRCGYTFEGVLRQSLVFKGQYRDTAVYSKLRTDPVFRSRT